MRENDDVVLNSFITGFGNNSASLLAGLAIIPTIFALAPSLGEAEAALRAGNDGLSFIVIPQLFNQLPAASIFSSVFFLGLLLAALSSLIAMLELSTRIMMDFGFSRRKALPMVSGMTALLGLPSAIWYRFFQNQDWVWGLGLILSGCFFAILLRGFGVEKFRREFLNVVKGDLKVGRWFTIVVKYFIPAEAAILIIWWLYRSVGWNPQGWYNPFQPDSLGTSITQWGLLIILLLIFNGLIVHRIKSIKENQ
jgi:NSS family neurotransmitter:Na+ symporter